MTHASHCITAVAALLFGTASHVAAAPNCRMTYPTRWHIDNATSQALQVQCRIYHTGWSYLGQRDEHFDVAARDRLTHEFSDHSDGLGMTFRDWSCAADQAPWPLLRAESAGFAFEGCADSTMALGELMRHSAAHDVAPRDVRATATCPAAATIVRLHACTAPGCQWDAYGSGAWRGNGPLFTPTELTDLEFVGADANAARDTALGCVYFARTQNKELILLAYERAGREPDNRYRPARANDFNKVTGHLRQCFGRQPSACPLASR